MAFIFGRGLCILEGLFFLVLVGGRSFLREGVVLEYWVEFLIRKVKMELFRGVGWIFGWGEMRSELEE